MAEPESPSIRRSKVGEQRTFNIGGTLVDGNLGGRPFTSIVRPDNLITEGLLRLCGSMKFEVSPNLSISGKDRRLSL